MMVAASNKTTFFICRSPKSNTYRIDSIQSKPKQLRHQRQRSMDSRTSTGLFPDAASERAEQPVCKGLV
jgi:hypothetical protein